MRTIKFRVWDKAYNKMVLPEKSNKYWINLLGDVREYDTWANEVVLMQFTGLHDKNGKEIYEGDIIKTENHATGIVTFYADEYGARFGFDCREPMFHHPIYGMGGKKEIIGNIYENPELLVDKNK